ncbi:hypothetical protein [Salinibacter ruber]|uniref:Uncharacterized protein n=1 Tax=Salinibacter ruber TaxID=146919 RepID=A0A9X2QAK4_9BACT|nr:hypothetical protein [Salinibacter ruber]MCS3661779.1 hypothetical protein [Salinibacter ruber]MCS3711560.1 hypothetical protein [Salinibacter ruber]
MIDSVVSDTEDWFSEQLHDLPVIDTEFNQRDHAPDQVRVWFANGYGISIIQGEMAYNTDDSNYEIAMIDRSGSIIYDGDVVSREDIGVEGPVSVERLVETMREIASLPTDWRANL